jgi:hypothetical protein
VTPATWPLVSMMQNDVPRAGVTLVSNIVPVVQAEYVGTEPFGDKCGKPGEPTRDRIGETAVITAP